MPDVEITVVGGIFKNIGSHNWMHSSASSYVLVSIGKDELLQTAVGHMTNNPFWDESFIVESLDTGSPMTLTIMSSHKFHKDTLLAHTTLKVDELPAGENRLKMQVADGSQGSVTLVINVSGLGAIGVPTDFEHQDHIDVESTPGFAKKQKSAGEGGGGSSGGKPKSSFAKYKARALYDFQGIVATGKLPLIEGDVIMVVGPEQAGGWLPAKLRHGKLKGARGMVPTTYVEKITQTELTSLQKRKAEIMADLQMRNKLIPNLEKHIMEAEDERTLDRIYFPYKPRQPRGAAAPPKKSKTTTEESDPWRQYWTDDGEVYYGNLDTGETSWTDPHGTKAESDWVEAEDENGDIYYWNRVTNETAWDVPGTFNEEEQAAATFLQTTIRGKLGRDEPKPTPSPKPAATPGPKTLPKPAIQPKPKPQPKPQTKPQPKPQPKPKAQLVAEPTPAAGGPPPPPPPPPAEATGGSRPPRGGLLSDLQGGGAKSSLKHKKSTEDKAAADGGGGSFLDQIQGGGGKSALHAPQERRERPPPKAGGSFLDEIKGGAKAGLKHNAKHKAEVSDSEEDPDNMQDALRRAMENKFRNIDSSDDDDDDDDDGWWEDEDTTAAAPVAPR